MAMRLPEGAAPPASLYHVIRELCFMNWGVGISRRQPVAGAESGRLDGAGKACCFCGARAYKPLNDAMISQPIREAEPACTQARYLWGKFQRRDLPAAA